MQCGIAVGALTLCCQRGEADLALLGQEISRGDGLKNNRRTLAEISGLMSRVCKDVRVQGRMDCTVDSVGRRPGRMNVVLFL